MNRQELIKRINNVQPGEVLHFYPEDDTEEHVLNEYCSCGPIKLIDCDVWVHNAHDGRQVVGWVNDILMKE